MCWSLQSKATRKIQMWRPRCENHCLQSFWYPSSWFLETADCPTSHHTSCCAYQMLITECVASQPKARNPWLQALVDIGSWAASEEDLFSRWQDLLPVFLSTNVLVRCQTSLIVHGSIGECVVTPKNGNLSLKSCQICAGKTAHFGDGFLRGAVALMTLCR